MREEQTTGTLEALSDDPVGPIELSVGLMGFPFLFASVQAAFYLAVASIFLGLDVVEHELARARRRALLSRALRLLRSGCSRVPQFSCSNEGS